MSTKTTQQSLGIFWDGEEVDGITVYGIWKNRPKHFPPLGQELGNEGVQERQSELRGEDWYVHVWDIKLGKWPLPAEWKSRIRSVLSRIIGEGAEVAWTGLEGAFVDPPDLFKPEHMTGGVWAAMSADEKLYFHAELEGQFQALNDDELHDLHKRI